MKFTRRPDLDPQTRIDIVKDVWINQGIYGKMTQIAQDYHISRTFLYQLSWAAKHQGSGSRGGLLPPSPLRTARASFPASSSSLSNALLRTRSCQGTAFTIRAWSLRTL